MSTDLLHTDRTSVSRHSERASYDRDLAYAILDEGLVAHVGLDSGSGVAVMPMTYARMGDELFLHGAIASRWLTATSRGLDISVCVTLLDGLVLAQSAFSHSMNYRSVVIFGKASIVTDIETKQAAFKAFIDHILPGRWEDCREPDPKEVAATTVIKLRIDEASVKVRSGPPQDAAKDQNLDNWTGVLPLSLVAGDALPDPAMKEKRSAPEYVSSYQRGIAG